jgi:hypothetical protein
MKNAADQGHARLQRANLWLQNLAIVAAGIWVFYTFVWQEFVRSYRDPLFVVPGLRLSVAEPAKRLTSGSEVTIVNVEMLITNAGKRRALIPGAYLSVGGSRFSVAEDPSLPAGVIVGDSYWPLQLEMPYFQEDPDSFDVLARAAAFPEWVLEPGETASRTFPIMVPRGRYDLLSARLWVLVRKGGVGVLLAEALGLDPATYRVEWRPEQVAGCGTDAAIPDDEVCWDVVRVVRGAGGGEEQQVTLGPSDDPVWEFDIFTSLVLPTDGPSQPGQAKEAQAGTEGAARGATDADGP